MQIDQITKKIFLKSLYVMNSFRGIHERSLQSERGDCLLRDIFQKGGRDGSSHADVLSAL